MHCPMWPDVSWTPVWQQMAGVTKHHCSCYCRWQVTNYLWATIE